RWEACTGGPSTGSEPQRGGRSRRRQCGCMSYLPVGYLIALGEARSCLAALADDAPTDGESAHFDRLLIELDGITGDAGPACSPMAETPAGLLSRLELATDRLIEYGVDRLSLELIVAAVTTSVGRIHPF